MARKLPKHHPGQIRQTVSLSISVPLELEDYMNRQAARHGMNRSQYICWLVYNAHYIERGQAPPPTLTQELPPAPRIPSRIKRKSA